MSNETNPPDWLGQIVSEFSSEVPSAPEPLPQESTDMATKKVEVAMDGAKATVEVKSPPKKKCSIKDVLPASVIPLVQAAPNNDTIRALLLAHLKVMVPKEEDTFEKVQNWIEFNVEKSAKPKSAIDTMFDRQIREAEEREARMVQVHVTASEREHGRCEYHHNLRGTGEMPIDRAVIEQAADRSTNPDDFFERVETVLSDTGPGNYLTMNVDREGANYDDHETEDTTEVEATISDAGRRTIKEVLRSANPELYERLFGQ